MQNYKLIFPYLQICVCVLLLSSCNIFRHKPANETQVSKESYQSRQIVENARNYIGTPYKLGGNDATGIDCSGLLCNSFKELGIKLPRISWQQAEFFQPSIFLIFGKVIWFFVTVGKNISHAGIVTDVKSEEQIMFIHASSSKGVIEDNMMSNYWKTRFAKVCRPQFGTSSMLVNNR